MRSSGVARAAPNFLVGADLAAAGYSTCLGPAMLALRCGRPRACGSSGGPAPPVLSIVSTPSAWAESYSAPLRPVPGCREQPGGHVLGRIVICQGAAGACTARWCRVPARTFFARLFGGWSLSRRRGGPRTPWLHEEVWPAIKSHCGPDPASIAPEGSTAGMLPSAGVGAPRRHHAAVRLRASVRRNQMAVSALISACTRLAPRTPRRPVGRIPVCTATCSAGTAPVGCFGAEAS